MRIGVAQIASQPGALLANIDRHLSLLRHVGERSLDLVLFPELSLTGYAPDLVGSDPIDPKDGRLDALQRTAEAIGTTVGVGLPIPGVDRPRIATVFLFPDGQRQVIGKRILHADELPIFEPADGPVGTLDTTPRIALAICYEISVPQHIEEAICAGAELYLASVAKTPDGIAQAKATLQQSARQHGVPVLVANAVGPCDGETAGGRSMAIDPSGALLAELGSDDEGALIYDCATGSVETMLLSPARIAEASRLRTP